MDVLSLVSPPPFRYLQTNKQRTKQRSESKHFHAATTPRVANRFRIPARDDKVHGGARSNARAHRRTLADYGANGNVAQLLCHRTQDKPRARNCRCRCRLRQPNHSRHYDRRTEGRDNELILVDLDDDLYASALPLSHLRYCLVGSNALAKSYALDFPDMGIVVTATQFNDLFRLEPLFRRHLREWGLDSSEPIGTLIAAAPEDLAGIIRAHPASDFFLPAQYRAAIEYAAGRSHDIWPALPAHVLLLSRQRVPRESPPAWSCRL